MNDWNDRKQAALAEVWSTYRIWAQTARETSDPIRKWRWTVLILAMGGTILSTAGQVYFSYLGVDATKDPDLLHRLPGIIGALALAAAGFFTKELLSDDAQKKWLRARATAEAAKSVSFLFRLGVPPYDAADAPKHVLQTLDEQRKVVEGINHVAITDDMRVKDLPTGPISIAEYTTRRVKDQIDWYEKRILEYDKLLRGLRRFTLGLGFLSVVLGILIAVPNVLPFEKSVPFTTALVPLVATLMASLSSHIAAGQYAHLVTTYQSAADGLRALKSAWSIEANPDDPIGQANYARRCENVMSVENSSWLAKLSGQPLAPSTTQKPTVDNQQSEEPTPGAGKAE